MKITPFYILNRVTQVLANNNPALAGTNMALGNGLPASTGPAGSVEQTTHILSLIRFFRFH